jgi:hypothetical protein
MTLYQTMIACIVTGILVFVVYKHVGLQAIKDCYGMWFTRKYWTNYNTVEALSWGTKAIIIVPGLIFGIQIWWLYFLTLATSLTLIWASNKKLLPTLVAFNTLWTWISVMVLVKSLV